MFYTRRPARLRKASRPADRRPFPTHGWVGLLLIALAWPLNWLLDGPRTHLLFFPLWFGYILTVDALVFRRRGSSILTRSRLQFASLFLLSVPVWWLFELFNRRTLNWHYLGVEHFSDAVYAILASIAFSTVIPAVFETAELVRSFRWVERMDPGPRVRARSSVTGSFFSAGSLLIALLVIWPAAFYPFLWAALFFVTAPLNVWLGRPSLFDHLERRDWRPVVSLALGALVCGFFWELWNVFAYPKWIYDTPGVNFWHIFEMPALGYLGYLPFGLELYAIGRLIRGARLDLRL